MPASIESPPRTEPPTRPNLNRRELARVQRMLARGGLSEREQKVAKAIRAPVTDADLAAEEQALELRRWHSINEVAQMLGVSYDRAWQLIHRGLLRHVESHRMTADALRRLEDGRIDEAMRGLREKVRAGDVQATNVLVRLMERRARMYGLDAPLQVEHEHKRQGEEWVKHLSDAELEALAMLEQVGRARQDEAAGVVTVDAEAVEVGGDVVPEDAET